MGLNTAISAPLRTSLRAYLTYPDCRFQSLKKEGEIV